MRNVEIRGLSVEPGPYAYASRRQLLERLRGAAARGDLAGQMSEEARAGDSEVGRCKRVRLTTDDAAAPLPYADVGARDRLEAPHGEPQGIRCTRGPSSYAVAATCRDVGVQGTSSGGEGPSRGVNVLETGATPTSIEDAKIHFIGDSVVGGGAASSGEAVEAGGVHYDATVEVGGGGPNSAAGDAAAAWAWHANSRPGEGGDLRHLSAN